ncbi:MAG: arylsulfotransferase family protein [Candidatus Altiarchaeota archaeon]
MKARTRILASSIILLLAFTGLAAYAIHPLLAGYWRDSPSADPSTERLVDLGYASWADVSPEDLNKSGVTYYDRRNAYDGLNFYASNTMTKAYLIDMDGRVVHSWDFNVPTEPWKHVELADNGNVFLVQYNLWKYDWDSNRLFKFKDGFHHDIDVSKGGRLYVLRDEYAMLDLPEYGLTKAKNNEIQVMLEDGTLLKNISLHDLVFVKDNDLPKKELLKKIVTNEYGENVGPKIREVDGKTIVSNERYDIFHTNTIEIVHRNITGFAVEGNALTAVRFLDLILVVDLDKEEIVWSWGQDDLQGPHQPTLMDNGNLLIYDNGLSRNYSRIIELNPLTKQIVWEYTANPPKSFYSEGMGGSQPLPNGNILITESTKGHAFEITRGGEIVWDFWNPEMNAEQKKRSTIYRMTRFSRQQLQEMNITV